MFLRLHRANLPSRRATEIHIPPGFQEDGLADLSAMSVQKFHFPSLKVLISRRRLDKPSSGGGIFLGGPKGS